LSHNTKVSFNWWY